MAIDVNPIHLNFGRRLREEIHLYRYWSVAWRRIGAYGHKRFSRRGLLLWLEVGTWGFEDCLRWLVLGPKLLHDGDVGGSGVGSRLAWDVW